MIAISVRVFTAVAQLALQRRLVAHQRERWRPQRSEARFLLELFASTSCSRCSEMYPWPCISR